jgi:hypothetical protein
VNSWVDLSLNRFPDDEQPVFLWVKSELLGSYVFNASYDSVIKKWFVVKPVAFGLIQYSVLPKNWVPFGWAPIQKNSQDFNYFLKITDEGFSNHK